MVDKLSIINQESTEGTAELQDRSLIERLAAIESLCGLIFTPKIIVSCPVMPVAIPGITVADELDANDVMGSIVVLPVPKAGVIYSATFWDLSNLGTQVNLLIFKQSIIQIASDSAWAPTDGDMLNFVTRIPFVSFASHTNSQTSEVTNIGKAYNAPEGRFYIQAMVGATAQTITVGNIPRFQLQILSQDPDF